MSFTFPDGSTVRQRLLSLRANGNKQFTEKLHPGVENVLGLRVPDLRKLAKEIAQADYKTYLSAPGNFYMEERMLHGFVLGLIPVRNTDDYLDEVAKFVRIINSWSVCDTFVFSGRQKFVCKDEKKIYSWLTAWLESEAEYEVRFGVVMLMQHYLTEPYLADILQRFSCIRHKAYYVSMALAWAISVVIVKFRKEGMAWLRSRPVDIETMKRSIQKCIDSYRISPELKEELRAMRKELC